MEVSRAAFGVRNELSAPFILFIYFFVLSGKFASRKEKYLMTFHCQSTPNSAIAIWDWGKILSSRKIVRQVAPTPHIGSRATSLLFKITNLLTLGRFGGTLTTFVQNYQSMAPTSSSSLHVVPSSLSGSISIPRNKPELESAQLARQARMSLLKCRFISSNRPSSPR